MTLGNLVRRLERVVVDNSPVILTAIGVTGALTTAYLSGKASFKAAELILNESYWAETEPETHPFEAKDKVRLVWRLYIPAATTGLLTVACIIMANRIGGRRAAALAVAYSLSERAFDEYKLKVIERIGSKKEQTIRDEIAQERVDRDPVSNKAVIVTGSGSVLCYESYTGRYFLCDMETLRKAENDVNHQVLHDSYASLSDLYDCIGLPHTANSEEVGWNSDRLLDISYSAVMSEDGKPCISVDFTVAPVRHYNRLQ